MGAQCQSDEHLSAHELDVKYTECRFKEEDWNCTLTRLKPGVILPCVGSHNCNIPAKKVDVELIKPDPKYRNIWNDNDEEEPSGEDPFTCGLCGKRGKLSEIPRENWKNGPWWHPECKEKEV